MRTLIKFTCGIAVAIFAAAQAKAVVITNDNFSYADGDLQTVSGGIWSNYSGATPMNVVGGQVHLTGVNSKDDQLRFDGGPHTNDVLFYCLDATVTNWPTGTGAYFAFFKDDSTFNFMARLMVTNAGGGTFRFGIANTAATALPGTAWSTSAYAFSTTHHLVIRLDQSGALASSTLWVDPTLITDPNYTATDVPTSTNINIQAFALRQSNATQGQALVDNLVVCTDFGDCVVPEPSTMVLAGAGFLGLLALRRRRS